MYKNITAAIKGIFGIPYHNGVTNRMLKDYLEENNLSIEDIIQKEEKNYCKQCNKEIPRKQIFCSLSCAASYNNKRKVLSQETKDKISKAMLKSNESSNRKVWISNNGKKRSRLLYEKQCIQCGKLFKTKNKNSEHCSRKCAAADPKVKEKQRQAQQKMIENGTHRGWQKRNIISYAEQFWIQVLENNNIPYKREDHSTKLYFLDFLIEKNGKKIDLEIDGKQHAYKDRSEHDKIRDDYLKSKGYIVYRIKWNSMLSEVGKGIMKEKINAFLNFYNTL